MLDDSIDKAEKYLLAMAFPGYECENFNELRYSVYYKKLCDYSDLPPTTDSIRLHILRAYYATHQQISLLEKNRRILDPLKYGYCYDDDDILMPKRNYILFPPISELVPCCHCTKCKNVRCCCYRNSLKCSKFCKCQQKKTCENI